MNQQSFKRYIWLIDTVYQSGKEGITFEKVCQKWQESELSKGKNYPLRTFHNHRKEVKDVFNVNIRCRKSTNSYYIAEGSRTSGIMKKMLELVTINQLCDGRNGLEDRMVLELRPGGECYLSKIMLAIQQRRMLSVEYQPYWTDKLLTYERFAPYAVKEVRGSWYLVGKRANYGYEMVDLKQVLSMTTLEEGFGEPTQEDLNAVLIENYGTRIENIATEQITLKVDAALACRLRKNPLHESQREIERKKNYSIFFFYLKPTMDFCRDILSFGSAMEVMNPTSLRSSIMQEARHVAKKNASE